MGLIFKCGIFDIIGDIDPLGFELGTPRVLCARTMRCAMGTKEIFATLSAPQNSSVNLNLAFLFHCVSTWGMMTVEYSCSKPKTPSKVICYCSLGNEEPKT